MPADLWEFMKQLHPPGSTVQYASPNGSSGNPGTANSRTDLATAWNRVKSGGGGIVYCSDGDYGRVSLSGNFSNGSWGLVKAENRHGAVCSGAGISGSYLGMWGFRCTSPASNWCFTFDGGHHQAFWCCWAANASWGGIGLAGNFFYGSNFSICYNLVHSNSYADFGSGISIYQASNRVGSQNHTWIAGYDNIIVGNISHSNYTNPGGRQSDSNGIILDDNWNLQTEYSIQPGERYLGNWLLMHNICTYNGGVGLHNLTTDNVDYYFNTVANNGRLWGDNQQGSGAGMDAVCGLYGGRLETPMSVFGNLVRENSSGQFGWFNDEYATAVTGSNNVYLYGSDNYRFNSRNRTSDGWNYFATNPPTLQPDLTTVAQWLPDGGSGQVERVTPNSTLASRLGIFPDLLGNFRPSNTPWTIGALETNGASSGGGGGGGSSPVAAFTASSVSVPVGDPVTFTDTSTNSPTTWSWNFGDSTTSTQQNPTKTWATPGTYTVTMLAANSSGSSQATRTITVTDSTIAAPVASFTFSPVSPEVGEVVTFTDTSTNTPTSWTWSFGD